MADFAPAFERTLRHEGGYTLSRVPADRGGMTFAGIARRHHPNWPGWGLVDAGAGEEDPFLRDMVREFYRREFWNRLRGDAITDQAVAESIYDCAVNMGPVTAVVTAQRCVGTNLDGVVGPKTLAALTAADPAVFLFKYTLERLRLYVQICRGDRTQRVFLLGWIDRALSFA